MTNLVKHVNLHQEVKQDVSDRVSNSSLAINMCIQNGEQKEHGTLGPQYIQNNLWIQKNDIFR